MTECCKETRKEVLAEVAKALKSEAAELLDKIDLLRAEVERLCAENARLRDERPMRVRQPYPGVTIVDTD